MLRNFRTGVGKLIEARKYAKNWFGTGMRRASGMHAWMRLWVTTPSGAKIWLDKDPVDDLILKDLYEIPEVFFPVSIEFNDGDLLLDLGTHHGIFIIEMLVRNPKLYAVCVEPDPWGCELLRKMAIRNKVTRRMEIHNFAIGDIESEAILIESADGSWGNHVTEQNDVPGKRIKQVPLSQVTKNRHFKLIKCNTEGGEYTIMPQVLALKMQPDFIILMTHGDQQKQSGLLSVIEAAGYNKKLVNDLPDNPSWHLIRK